MECKKQKRASIVIEALSFDFKWSVERNLAKATGKEQLNKEMTVVRTFDCF
jgi:hypothetical protein